MDDRPTDDQRNITFWIKEVNYSSSNHESATRQTQVPFDATLVGTYDDPEHHIIRVLFAQVGMTDWEKKAQAEQEAQRKQYESTVQSLNAFLPTEEEDEDGASRPTGSGKD